MTATQVAAKRVSVEADATSDIVSFDTMTANLRADVDRAVSTIQPALDKGQLVLTKFSEDKTGKYFDSPEVSACLAELGEARETPANIAKAAKKHYNAVEAKRTGLKAPILKAGKELDDFFKPTKTACEAVKTAASGHTFEVDSLINRITLAANSQVQAEQTRIAKEEEARRKAQAALDIEEVPEPVIMKKPEVIAAPVTKDTRTYWKFEVTDPKLVPDTFTVDGIVKTLKTVNEAEIGKIVRNSQGRIEIPGVRTYSEKGIVA